VRACKERFLRKGENERKEKKEKEKKEKKEKDASKE
jgi:hypothetical protein